MSTRTILAQDEHGTRDHEMTVLRSRKTENAILKVVFAKGKMEDFVAIN